MSSDDTDTNVWVKQLVDQAPPLTAEQRASLGELLKPVRTILNGGVNPSGRDANVPATTSPIAGFPTTIDAADSSGE
jgi:hypothetical protein